MWIINNVGTSNKLGGTLRIDIRVQPAQMQTDAMEDCEAAVLNHRQHSAAMAAHHRLGSISHSSDQHIP